LTQQRLDASIGKQPVPDETDVHGQFARERDFDQIVDLLDQRPAIILRAELQHLKHLLFDD
jgi:hypothetical protein